MKYNQTEKELYEKYPHLFEEMTSTTNLLKIVLQITIGGWIIAGLYIVYLLGEI